MILKKAMLLGAAMALASTPAWALPSNEHAHKGSHHPASTPNDKSNPGSSKRSESGEKHGGGAERKGKGEGKGKGKGKGKSHKCMAHGVAYVASGTLVSDTLTENANHTVSGELTVEVLRTNHHARADKGTTKTYTVEKAHVTLAVPDSDEDGTIAVDDLVAGDRVKVIGKITTVAKKCKAGESKLTVRRLVFHGPQSSETTTTTTSESTTSSATTSTTTTSTSTTTT